MRPQASFAGLIGAALAGSLLFGSGPAVAGELTASISWQGECDDRSSLHAELELRAVKLNEVSPAENVASVAVSVQRTPQKSLIADVLLVTPGAHEQRRVEARECEGLRRALAWVLWAVAEERTAEREQSGRPAVATFPSAPPGAAPTPVSALPAPPISPPRVSVAPRRPAHRQPPQPCRAGEPRIGLGAELRFGVGMVETAALGPALVASYRPCARYLPGVAFGVSRLQTLGYEVAARSISIVRTSAQLGTWFELAGPALRAGLALEAGRIHASGGGSGEGRGLSSNAPWLAFVAPLRLSVPLVARTLSLEAGLAAAYTPQEFTLRYASGEVLARPRHFELRGSFGVAGHF